MAGGSAVVTTSRTQARGRRQHQKPSLPFDVMVEIVACSDPATLVRFAATCREARRRVADDPTFRGRLRLRHTDRFVLPLLRGHLALECSFFTNNKDVLWLVDTTAADVTKLVKVREGLASGPGCKHLTKLKPVSSRDGVLLIRATNTQSNREELLVCGTATRRSQILPPQPPKPDTFPTWSHPQHVLLVGDGETSGDVGEVGRPFQVVNVIKVPSSKQCRNNNEWCMHIQTFSSENGTWDPYTETRTRANNLIRCGSYESDPLVVDDVLYWMCLTGNGSYVLMLHVKAKRLTPTMLPTRFPHLIPGANTSYLLATNSVCGSPIVLVADDEKISMWVQCKHTARWKEQPQIVIKNDDILQFDNVSDSLEGRPWKVYLELVCFSERSGAVLIRIRNWCLFWLDLQSKKIVRWFADRRVNSASMYCPYEMDLSSWVPSFNSTL
ncbi:hypothetical protein QOZ80_7AG0580540 [Eleusine coracana subsp. coracana]|nr:hypothetical protein QOZ80_7AG0580540 [Eleusine coracana subsp. coracana]